jgi:pimeloyl-ACP methyl ester carboxylesterase
MTDHVVLRIEGTERNIEYKRISAQHPAAPLIVFLHEGLGSLSMWEDWPDRLCQATGAAGLVFSRYGYGKSTLRTDKEWPTDYLEQEARVMLPALFDALEINPKKEKVILFGHSDGGTISLLYSAAYPDLPSAVVVLAPHEFVEEMGTARIAQLKRGFHSNGLAEKLSKHQPDAHAVFTGWSELWLSPRYRDWNIEDCLGRITCPLLAVQGAQDQYGTLEQIRTIMRHVPQAECVILEDCRHVPHQEQPEQLLLHTQRFLASHTLLSLSIATMQ